MSDKTPEEHQCPHCDHRYFTKSYLDEHIEREHAKDKTPEKLAREHRATVCVLGCSYFTIEEFDAAYLAGYHARDAEIVELRKQLNKAQDPYGE